MEKCSLSDSQCVVYRSTMYWRWTALIVYLIICFYDFMVVPVWYGLNRPDISEFMDILKCYARTNGTDGANEEAHRTAFPVYFDEWWLVSPGLWCNTDRQRIRIKQIKVV